MWRVAVSILRMAQFSKTLKIRCYLTEIRIVNLIYTFFVEIECRKVAEDKPIGKDICLKEL
jgi:hypothetical protein